MNHRWLAGSLVGCALIFCVVGYADQPADSEMMNISDPSTIKAMDDAAQNSRLKELARALENLGRRIDRIDDRVEKLDQDLKDIKRKV